MISVILIVSTVVIRDQMEFLHNQDLGFDKNGQVVIALRGSVAKDRKDALEAEFQRIGQVISSGSALYYPGLANPSDNLLYRDGQHSQEAQEARMNYVDFGFMNALGVKAVAGHLFSKEYPGDTAQTIILNESSVKALGYSSPEAAIGTKVDADFRGETYKSVVVGVVRDFHFEDLHRLITPYAFRLTRGTSYLLVHAKPGAPGPLLAALAAAWHQVDRDEPFNIPSSMRISRKTTSVEERLSALIRYFTVMAILISCLGLFGLASFSAEQRVREIGIRKVLGVSVSTIVVMLTRDFVWLVGLAMLFAIPVAWLMMRGWLRDFAYRTAISWDVFLITFLATSFITMVTISFHAVRAGLANPVKSLKTD